MAILEAMERTNPAAYEAIMQERAEAVRSHCIDRRCYVRRVFFCLSIGSITFCELTPILLQEREHQAHLQSIRAEVQELRDKAMVRS